jgi:hypothetical protein
VSNNKSSIIFFFCLLAGLSLTVNADSWKSFFTAKEMQIIEQADEIASNYSPVGFKIEQIINKSRSLVSSGDFEYMYMGDLTDRSDGDILTDAAKMGESVTYKTATGSQRTVKSLIPISTKEKAILEQSIDLDKRRTLVLKELKREEGESRYQELKPYIDEYLEIANGFIDKSSNSNNSDVKLLREELLESMPSYNEALKTGEYYGAEINSETINSFKMQVKLSSSILDRENNQEARDAEIAKAEKAKRNEEIRQQLKDEKKAEIAAFENWERDCVFFENLRQVFEEDVKKKAGTSSVNFMDEDNALKALGGVELMKTYDGVSIGLKNLKFSIDRGAQVKPKNFDDMPNNISWGIVPEKLAIIFETFESHAPELFIKAEMMSE